MCKKGQWVSDNKVISDYCGIVVNSNVVNSGQGFLQVLRDQIQKSTCQLGMTGSKLL